MILLLVFCLIVYGLVEYRRHVTQVRSIPMRIHVNGTRGKSSVTRLIAAGLREGGIRTVAKTTGTRARLIYEDGGEEPVVRHGKPNVIEQLKIFRIANRHDAQALVLECMAIRPELQSVSERMMVHATLGVITNVRGDHLDEMGPTLENVALALSLTIPRKGIVFTAERELLPIIVRQAKDLKAKVHAVGGDGIPEEVMSRFTYIEHRENVALASAVCEFVGIDRETALQGMVKAVPDPGALRRLTIRSSNKEIEFINAFAANDPESTVSIWKQLRISSHADRPLITIFYNREDRLDRTEEFGKLVAHELKADHCILIGTATPVVEHIAVKEGLDKRTIVNMAGMSPERIFEKVVELTPQKSLVVGIGNIVGAGEQVASFFESKGTAA
ncbi:MAG: poly-gamma-glutamate synthase PgsB [Gemmatimonadota bacterium]|nr:MAG: poly-gamma-glutamate synthase PgsB [Gemmatimonadota bacterium]